MANELPGPDGRKRFGSHPGCRGVFRRPPPTPPWHSGVDDGPRAECRAQPHQDGDAPIDGWGVRRANLHHICRLFDLPAAEAALAVSVL